MAPEGRTHPTFVEPGTNRPLYVHREGSNAFNGRYYVDGNPKGTIAHYSSFRPIDVAGLRQRYERSPETVPGRARARVAPGAWRAGEAASTFLRGHGRSEPVSVG